jgi:hypothetical protein
MKKTKIALLIFVVLLFMSTAILNNEALYAGGENPPRGRVIVNANIGACYTEFTVEGIRAAFDFCSHARWSYIDFPAGTLLIDDPIVGNSIFTLKVNTCTIHGAGENKTRFVVLCNKTLFNINLNGNLCMSDINITIVTNGNGDYPCVLNFIGEGGGFYVDLSNTWMSIITYKQFIHRVLGQ